MKLKRMPVSYTLISPICIILVVFLLSGAVLGALCGIYAPSFNITEALLENSDKSMFSCIINALKYSIFPIIFCKALGFLIPFFVCFRGFCLFFSVTAIYKSAETFFDKTIVYESIAINLLAIPCFLFIATACLNLYVSGQKNRRPKKGRPTEIVQICFFLTINLIWNFICYLIF